MIFCKTRKPSVKFLAFFLFLAGSFCFAQQKEDDKKELTIEDYKLMLGDEKPKSRLESIYALSKIEGYEAEKILVEQYRKEKDNYLKTQIIEALSIRKSSDSQKVLIEALSDKNKEVRKNAWLNLQEDMFSNEVNLKILLKKFKGEENKEVKMSAVWSFSKSKSTETVKEIAGIVSDSMQPIEIRKLAVQVLGRIGNEAAKKELKRFSKSKDKEIAKESEKHIGK